MSWQDLEQILPAKVYIEFRKKYDELHRNNGTPEKFIVWSEVLTKLLLEYEDPDDNIPCN